MRLPLSAKSTRLVTDSLSWLATLNRDSAQSPYLHTSFSRSMDTLSEIHGEDRGEPSKIHGSQSQVGSSDAEKLHPSKWKRLRSQSETQKAFEMKRVGKTGKKPARLQHHAIDQAITCTAMALEVDNEGNEELALNLYFTGLELLLGALSIESDARGKEELQKRLTEWMGSRGMKVATPRPEYNREGYWVFLNAESIFGSLFELLVWGLNSLRNSPLSYIAHLMLIHFLQLMCQIEARYQVRDMLMQLVLGWISWAVEMEKRHGIVQKGIDVACTAFAAIVMYSASVFETYAAVEKEQRGKLEKIQN
ncbi:uncharacterized protein VTP21DRAFT_1676 [Calcarisporiella thermophila]|uniref:uncharacterized protein n=1 Tax=Calcarisporiella thermophila TaxID=911321 RepID=UPI0037447E40